jgi:hypothetical protein
MADAKISALTNLTAADAINDMIPIVDVSDTPPASGNTKRISINNILGASGTATLASATITGAATVGTTLGVTGNTTLSSDLTVRTNTISATSSGVGFGITTAAAAIDVVSSFQWRSNTAGTDKFAMFSGGTGLIYLGSTTASSLAFIYSGAEAMRLNSTGNLVLKGGTAAAPGVGVTFPATQVASSDANCLDDYEEAAWVPTITGQVNCTAVTSVSAQYTKVGRLVTLSGYATANVTTANLVTYFALGSLPFTAAAVTIGSLIENASYKPGVSQVSGTTLYGFFSAVVQLTTGAKDFYYTISYYV